MDTYSTSFSTILLYYQFTSFSLEKDLLILENRKKALHSLFRKGCKALENVI